MPNVRKARKPRFKPKALSKPQRVAVGQIAKKAVTSLAERKYFILYQVDQEGAYDAALETDLTASIAQGDADTQRQGDSIRLTSLEMRGSVTYQAANQINGRLIVICLKTGVQNIGASSTAALGLAGLLQNGASSDAAWDFYRNDTKNRFQVLYDRNFTSQDTGAGGTNNSAHFHTLIPLKDRVVQYDASTARVTKNAIILFWFSNVGTAVNTGPYLNVGTKLRYIDF